MARRWSFRAAASVRAVRHLPETLLEYQTATSAFPFASSREAHVAQTPFPQRQSAGSQWQRADLGLESPSYIHSCPFVSIRGSTSPLRLLRVFASSRETNSPPPSPRSCSPQAASCRGQISGWKARATFILVHSCPFVVQRHLCVSLRVFASSREANSPQTPVLAAAISSQPVAEGRSRAGKPELRLIESGDRGH